MVRSTLVLAGVLLVTAVPLPGSQQDSPASDSDQPSVSVIRVEEPITPTSTDYITRALAAAEERGSACLVIELDTPGGLLESTRHIVQAFFESEVPVVVYVSPDGARAASAGTFITMAAHLAAMAPSTTIGAASPVSMSPGGQSDTVMQKKAFSYAESFRGPACEVGRTQPGRVLELIERTRPDYAPPIYERFETGILTRR